MVMAEDCIKKVLMFLPRESNFTGNKLVNQPQKNSVCFIIQAGFPRTKKET